MYGSANRGVPLHIYVVELRQRIKMMNTMIDEKDRVTVYAQLKRKPRGLKKIASRCVFSCPQVVETNAFIEKGKPFPTLYWLTCPLKVKAVSRLEDDGWAERLRERLALDEDLRRRLEYAQEEYKHRRRAGTRTDEVDHPVFDTGVGGVHNLSAVKCLHAHYAHYLAHGNNPVGELVEKELSKMSDLDCKEPCDRR